MYAPCLRTSPVGSPKWPPKTLWRAGHFFSPLAPPKSDFGPARPSFVSGTPSPRPQLGAAWGGPGHNETAASDARATPGSETRHAAADDLTSGHLLMAGGRLGFLAGRSDASLHLRRRSVCATAASVPGAPFEASALMVRQASRWPAGVKAISSVRLPGRYI